MGSTIVGSTNRCSKLMSSNCRLRFKVLNAAHTQEVTSLSYDVPRHTHGVSNPSYGEASYIHGV
jgi:hypothetical protein